MRERERERDWTGVILDVKSEVRRQRKTERERYIFDWGPVRS